MLPNISYLFESSILPSECAADGKFENFLLGQFDIRVVVFILYVIGKGSDILHISINVATVASR